MANLRVRAGLPWALVVMGMALFLGSLIFAMLDPEVTRLLDMAGQLTDSQDATTGIDRIQQFWDLWPVWFLGAVLMYGYVQSVRKSRRGI